MLYLSAAAFGIMLFHIDARISEEFDREMNLRLRDHCTPVAPYRRPQLRLVYNAGKAVSPRVSYLITGAFPRLLSSLSKVIR